MEKLRGDDNQALDYDMLGLRRNGGYAEYVNVPAESCAIIPEHLSYEEAASIPLVFLTAWHMLNARAKLRCGETVLVNAAGSGVGIAAIQIAKLLGARVIASAGSDAKLEKAKDLGADDVVNYTTEDLAKRVREMTNKVGVNVVVEHIGGEVLDHSFRALARGGRLVTCGCTAGPNFTFDIRLLYARHCTILGSYMGRKEEYFEMLKFFHTRQLRPVVDQMFPLKEAAAAHRRMEERAQFGKLVLVP
jgi:NADPH:quinone reductase-like Zn-dependent oxidoreductase